MAMRLLNLAATLLLPSAQAVLLPGAIGTTMALFRPHPAYAQSTEAVAGMAQAITVRIEGATQGSGVLINREGTRYTVLTAWHVVSGQRSGEELAITTPDEQQHSLEEGSIKRVGQLDLAVLTFNATVDYQIARPINAKSPAIYSLIYVAGFPSQKEGRLAISKGRLVANADVGVDQGYQLLYTNNTGPGVSGGPVLNANAELLGIHGRGELDSAIQDYRVAPIKTGINQGIPFRYYVLHASGLPIRPSSNAASTSDDYIAQSREILRPYSSVIQCQDERGCGNEYIPDNVLKVALRLLDQALNKGVVVPEIFNLRGQTLFSLGDKISGCSDIDKAIALKPDYEDAYYHRGICRMFSNNYADAIRDFDIAISLNPANAAAYVKRGDSRLKVGDQVGAKQDYDSAKRINPAALMHGL